MRNQRISLICMALLAVAVPTPTIRVIASTKPSANDNLGTLRRLLKTSAADARDQRETTHLMYAARFYSNCRFAYTDNSAEAKPAMTHPIER